jgi:hypothetical protein
MLKLIRNRDRSEDGSARAEAVLLVADATWPCLRGPDELRMRLRLPPKQAEVAHAILTRASCPASRKRRRG